jgi:hypothetical protein
VRSSQESSPELETGPVVPIPSWSKYPKTNQETCRSPEGGEMDLFVVLPQDPGLCQGNRAFLHGWARQKGNEEPLTIASPAIARPCNRLKKFVPSVGFHDSDMLSSGVSNFSGLTPWYSLPYRQSFAAYCATPSEMRCHGMYGRLTFVTHFR